MNWLYRILFFPILIPGSYRFRVRPDLLPAILIKEVPKDMKIASLEKSEEFPIPVVFCPPAWPGALEEGYLFKCDEPHAYLNPEVLQYVEWPENKAFEFTKQILYVYLEILEEKVDEGIQG